MVAATRPFAIGADLHSSQSHCPILWDEAVVDVIRSLLVALKIKGSLLLLAMNLALEVVIATHQPKLGKQSH